MNNSTEPLQIACALDRNLIMQAVVMLHSLARAAASSTTYRVNVLYHPSELNEEEVRFLGTTASSEKTVMNFIEVGERFNASPDVRHLTRPTYYRLAMTDLVPGIKRALYLDIDTIILADLADLFATDMEGCSVAGTRNFFLYNKVGHCEQLGIRLGNYINCGVLLMNLEYIKEQGMTQKFMDLAGTSFKYADQDIINQVCEASKTHLPPKYNVHASFPYTDPDEVSRCVHSREDLDEAIGDPRIIHYAGDKPWNSGNCLFADRWWEHYRSSNSFDPGDYVSRQVGIMQDMRERMNAPPPGSGSLPSILSRLVRKLRPKS